MDDGWTLLLKLLILLGAALLLGALAERLRLSAMIGYLVAGTIIGPNATGLVARSDVVELFAELGIALLLFSIGLEFSFRDLRALGRSTLLAGLGQILLTSTVAALLVLPLENTGLRSAAAVGLMVAMSSTACVLRLLVDTAQIDSPHGRGAMGVLLLQDAAVLPATLLVTALAGGGGLGVIGGNLLRTLALTAGMAVVFVLALRLAAPRLLRLREWSRNRELPILLAIVLATGAALAAHEIGVSPAIGAFLAGALLAESPFATQVRADVAPIKTVLLTLFFASVGMLSDPAWALRHAWMVGSAALAIVGGKTLLAYVAFRLARAPRGIALASALCLAQVGEFSFVLAQIARDRVIDGELFNLLIAATVISLILTPFAVGLASRAARWRETGRLFAPTPAAGDLPAGGDAPDPATAPRGAVLIVGFGPAGQRVAEMLLNRYAESIRVIDLNSRAVVVAEGYGLRVVVGDACQTEVLEHAGIRRAAAVVVSLPDPAAVRQVIQLCRDLNPAAAIVARSRYHATRWELQLAGAHTVVDEEEQVGLRMAIEVRAHLRGRRGG